MFYQEYKPQSYLSQHVESFWELRRDSFEDKVGSIIFPPELIFDILFVKSPVSFRFTNSPKWQKLAYGAYFVGLTNQGILFNLQKEAKLFGLRLKPFALANIRKQPLQAFKNRITNLDTIFEVADPKMVTSILDIEIIELKIEQVQLLLAKILEDNSLIRKTLRDKINYIMEWRGNLKIADLHKVFDTNKVTLRNQFVNNMGLTPKEVSKIMRFNNFLKLSNNSDEQKLTTLSYDAGYYDQSHFIKDFRSFLNCSPKVIFKAHHLIEFSQERITKRFTSYYSPIV